MKGSDVRGWQTRRDHAVRRALRVLASVETSSPVLTTTRRPARFTTNDWSAVRRSDTSRDVMYRLPGDDRDHLPPSARQMWARSSATTLRVAKMGEHASLRFRAFYLGSKAPSAVKVAVGPESATRRIEREITARREIGNRLPTPELLDVGEFNDGCYLVEETTFGVHPSTPAEKQNVALALVDDLVAFHREREVTDRRLDVHAATGERLERLFATDWVHTQDASGPLDVPAMVAPIMEIIADDRSMPVGWGHGDLGFSNIITTASGQPVIIDWEHAGEMPAVTDLTKLAVIAPNTRHVVDRILHQATADDIGGRPGRMPLARQLAAVTVRELSWWEGRRERAAAAGRLGPFNRGVRRRFRLLARLIEADRVG